MPEPPKIFISYSRADKAWKDRLVQQLEVLHLEKKLTLWDDERRIAAGDDWLIEIEAALEAADAAVLLISAAFLTSEFIRKVEVPRLLERRANEGIRIIPLLIKPSPWKRVDWLEKLRCRPSEGRVLARMSKAMADQELAALAEEIDDLLRRPPEPSPVDAGSPRTSAARPITQARGGELAAAEEAVLAEWFTQMADEHRRLADHFERPVELQDLEKAWVRLELELPEGGPATLPSAAEHEGFLESRLAHRTLDDYLALEPEQHPWVTRRWLVQGDPGSGKTTLLRHLIHRKANERNPLRVPLFVSLPTLVDPFRRLLHYLADEYSALCGAELPRILDQAGRDGRLLVLLDSLDEVAPEHRKRVERLLAALDREWPRSSVVLTSRPIGLGRLPPGFHRLLLQPLDDTQRQRFLANWFRHRARPEPALEAERAGVHFDSERSLRQLSHNPLHLTLLTVLWEKGVKAPTRRSELYKAIFELLLEGRHKDPPMPIKATADVREALRHLAFELTRDDLAGEPPEKLEQRLRDPEVEALRGRLETAWGKRLRDFLDEVSVRTYILGPHDGPRTPWRFWHRTFREALTAEKLKELFEDDQSALLEQVKVREAAPVPRLLRTILRTWWPGARSESSDAGEDELILALHKGDEGRWAEPFAILAGHLDDPDAWVRSLVKANRALGLRAFATAQGLTEETLRAILGLTGSWQERRQVFESIPEQLGDPEAILSLVDRLRRSTRNGNDLFFLHRLAEETGERWPASGRRALELSDRFFDHIPPPEDPELFHKVGTPRDGQVELWCKIPAGHGWIGSPEGVGLVNEHPRHRVTIAHPFRLMAVPVTNAQYAVFDPEKAGGEPHHPVDSVTWYEAVSFCRWLSTLPDLAGARLPTEEEWEYACRAGSEAAYWNGDGREALAEVGWYDANSDGRLHRVGEKRANPWGLYDVHGNVWEWTATVWDKDRYSGRDATGVTVDPPLEPADLAAHPGAGRVIRGGSYWDGADRARSACRYGVVPGWGDWFPGFRVLVPGAPSSGSTVDL